MFLVKVNLVRYRGDNIEKLGIIHFDMSRCSSSVSCDSFFADLFVTTLILHATLKVCN